MQQMLRVGITAVFLTLCTYQDIKSGKIAMEPVLVFAAAGLGWNLMFQRPWQLCMEGILPGMGVLLFGKLSGEQIGYGDGIVLAVMGLFLTAKETAGMFLTALFLCGTAAVALFFAGKLRKRMSLPFLPFLTAGYGIQLLLAASAGQV